MSTETKLLQFILILYLHFSSIAESLYSLFTYKYMLQLQAATHRLFFPKSQQYLLF